MSADENRRLAALRRSEAAERLSKLDAVLAGGHSMAIVLQDNPDPDSIAAAVALREIANERHDIACSVAHGGTIGRAENQALVRYLGLNIRPLTGIEVGRFDRLAMVDAQPGAGNVQLAGTVRLDVVIDHHPIRRETRSARFTDIRGHYGAASTILWEYLRAAGIEIETPLATALVYGIRSDTQDHGRDSTRADLEAYLDLYPSANPRVLGRILAAPLPLAYFASLRRALDSATVFDTRVVSYLDRLESQEMMAEVADLLLRTEGMVWSFCLGVVGDVLHGSLRSADRDHDAGQLAHKLALRRGFGGGHHMLAGIQIPLTPEQLQPRRLERLVCHLNQRFLELTGGVTPGVPLCPGASGACLNT